MFGKGIRSTAWMGKSVTTFSEDRLIISELCKMTL